MAEFSEVVVVGAGPGGSIAALDLANSGIEVTLIDRDTFPRSKVCGDELAPEGVRILSEYGITHLDRLPEFHPISRVHLHAPDGSTLPLRFRHMESTPEIFIVPRKILDTLIYEHARDAGAKYIQGNVTGLMRLENGRYQIQYRYKRAVKKIMCNVIIGADGSTSTVAQHVHNKKYSDVTRAIAIRAYAEGMTVSPGTIEGLLHQEWWPGYAWIFPLGEDRANIGVGMNLKFYKEHNTHLRTLFNQVFSKSVLDGRMRSGFRISDVRSWPLNLGPPNWNRVVSGRILLVGDAAGLVNPLTGGGIVNAMTSAQVAAQSIKQYLQGTTTSLKPYSEQLRLIMSSELRLSQIFQQTFSRNPWLLQSIIRAATFSHLPLSLVNLIYDDVEIIRDTVQVLDR